MMSFGLRPKTDIEANTSLSPILMNNIHQTSRVRRIFMPVMIGAMSFALCGPWVYDTLVRYGFEIFSATTPSQSLALWLAVLLSLPAAAFLEGDPGTFASMAINGGCWAALVYWMLIPGWRAVRERMHSRRTRE